MNFKDFYPDSLAGVIIQTTEKLSLETLHNLEKYKTISEMKSTLNATPDILLVFQPREKPALSIELVVCGTLCWYENTFIVFTGEVKTVKSGERYITPDKELAFQYDYYPNQHHCSLLHLYYAE